MKKNFHDEKLPNELFLKIRQKTKIRKAFANNTSTEIKLSKAKLMKIIELRQFLGEQLCLSSDRSCCCFG